MIYWEKLLEEKAEGFDIVLSIAPEDIDPADCFDDSIDDINEIKQRMSIGLSHWFVARVSAYRHGIELSSEYLGGNLYDDPMEFVTDGYFDDLKYQAIEEAKKAIQLLTEEAPQ